VAEPAAQWSRRVTSRNARNKERHSLGLDRPTQACRLLPCHFSRAFISFLRYLQLPTPGTNRLTAVSALNTKSGAGVTQPLWRTPTGAAERGDRPRQRGCASSKLEATVHLCPSSKGRCACRSRSGSIKDFFASCCQYATNGARLPQISLHTR
jgi:hypothetical protein